MASAVNPTKPLYFLVGGSGVASVSHVNDLSKSAGHSGALRRNGYLRPVPHPVRLKAGKPEIRKQTQKSSSSFGESDGPMTELWCEGSAMKEGSQGGNLQSSGCSRDAMGQRMTKQGANRWATKQFSI